MKEKAAGSVPSGMLVDFIGKWGKGIITTKQVARFLQKENPFEEKHSLQKWIAFYKKHQKSLGLSNQVITGLSGVVVPERKNGFNLLVVIPQGLTENQAFTVCGNFFPRKSYIGNDLTTAVKGRNERESTQSYALWVRDRQEADEETKNLSANQIRERRVKTMTLLERIILELYYWEQTGNHMDVVNITLCAGSCGGVGSVPVVDWNVGKLWVDWWFPRFAGSGLRSRPVVS